MPTRLLPLRHALAAWDWDVDPDLSRELLFVEDGSPWKSHLLYRQPVASGALTTPASTAAIFNSAALKARGKYLFLLPDDLEAVEPDALARLVGSLEDDPTIGAVAPLVTSRRRTRVRGARWDGRSGRFRVVSRPRASGLVLARPVMVRADVFAALAGFPRGSPRAGPLDEWDFGLRMRALGYRSVVEPRARLRVGGALRREYTPTASFSARWVRPGHLQRVLEMPPSLTRASRPGIVVYTAITANRDPLREQPESCRGHRRFAAFLDRETALRQARSRTWSIRRLKRGSDAYLDAKRPKILSHLYFPQHRYSLWIDASISLVCPFGIERLIELYLQGADLCVLRHSHRSCTYAEARACIEKKLDDPRVIRRQMARYQAEGLPPDAGLAECPVILRRHCRAVADFNEAWWREIQAGSRRDQLSFMYVAWRQGLRFRYFPLPISHQNGLFRKHPRG